MVGLDRLRVLRGMVKAGKLTVGEFMKAREQLLAKRDLVTKAAAAPVLRKPANRQLVGTALRRARALEAKVDTVDHAARVRIAGSARAQARKLLLGKNR